MNIADTSTAERDYLRAVLRTVEAAHQRVGQGWVPPLAVHDMAEQVVAALGKPLKPDELWQKVAVPPLHRLSIIDTLEAAGRVRRLRSGTGWGLVRYVRVETP